MKKVCRAVKKLGLTALFLLTLISITPAAEAGPFYAGIFGSYAIPDDLKLEGNPSSKEVKLNNTRALRAKTGYITPADKWLAFEWEYASLPKQDIDTPRLDGDNKAQNLMTNLLLKYPSGKIQPYSGVGVGWSWTKMKADLLDESDKAFAWQLMAGVNYEIMPNWSADFAYRYFTSKYEFENDDAKDNNHAVVLGVNYHF